MEYIDLRSDTVTKPSKEMRRVISEAEVGDDVLGDDPTVNRLQDYVAELFDREASLYVPSGTMGNQAALKTISEPGWEIICDRDCHIVNYETGGPAIHSSLLVNMITTERGMFTAEKIGGMVRPSNIHMPITKIVEIENTHNRHGGAIFPLDEIKKIRGVADRHNLMMHLDGARIWNAHVATGIPLADWVKPFDSVSVCLSKGLGAPVGSMIIGNRDFIEKCRRTRKLFGGGMRQVGILAAGGLYAVQNNIERLKEDHEKARALAMGFNAIDGFSIDPDSVETNIVIVNIAGTGQDSEAVASKLAEMGVHSIPFGGVKIRFVTHMDVSMEQCRKAVEIASEIDW